MAYNQINCLATLSNTGLAACTEKLGYIAKVIWLKSDFEIDTEANALLQATWETAINAKNAYPFPLFEKVEPQNEEDVFEDLPNGNRVFVREGKQREIGHVNLAMCNLKRLRTFNNVKGALALITDNGYILMQSPDGVKVKGISLQQFRVGGIGMTDGSTSRMTPISYGLADPTQLNDFGVALKPSWNPLDLQGIIDVDIAIVGTETTSLLNFTVTRVCDGEGVEGLVEGDFSFLVTAGTAQTATFTEIGDGTYRYSATATIADGSLNLKTPALQTTGGYESTGVQAVDVT